MSVGGALPAVTVIPLYPLPESMKAAIPNGQQALCNPWRFQLCPEGVRVLPSTACCLPAPLRERLQVEILGSQVSVASPAHLTFPLVGPCHKHLKTRYCQNLIHILVSGATQWCCILLLPQFLSNSRLLLNSKGRG